ncbi:Ras-GEF domain-containing family member 1A [Orchesella cincta]|uniref:Ras-GEF domain-containing family member 1A n=1 Tax=Orchesella cincta TaxID=48709 RepID=A0A1D2MMJ5_ORCCI|nr:Ras-GEF domain-containing family member 1A [Orchesella cincta]
MLSAYDAKCTARYCCTCFIFLKMSFLIRLILEMALALQSSGTGEMDLIFNGPHLMSGTWEALVQHLLPTEAHFPDQDYIFAFLLSARLYVQPHELLGRIFQEVIDVSGSTENSPRSSPQHVRALVGGAGGGATTTTAFGLTDLSEISETFKR